MSVAANFADIYLQGIRDRSIQNRIGAENPDNWLVNSSRTTQTGLCGFDQAITGAIYFTFHDWKKSSFDRRNHTSLEVFHFIQDQTLKHKFVLTNKIFFANSIQFVACALRENLSNLSSGVQIPRDTCTRFGRCFYSSKRSWIINVSIFQG